MTTIERLPLLLGFIMNAVHQEFVRISQNRVHGADMTQALTTLKAYLAALTGSNLEYAQLVQVTKVVAGYLIQINPPRIGGVAVDRPTKGRSPIDGRLMDALQPAVSRLRQNMVDRADPSTFVYTGHMTPQSLDLSCFDPPSADLLALLDEASCRKYGVLPIWRDRDSKAIFAWDGEDQDVPGGLHTIFTSQSIVFRLAQADNLQAVIDQAFPSDDED